MRIVWARGPLAIKECPTSYIKAESLAWLERFWVWKALGGVVSDTTHAREVDALLTLEVAWREEQRNESK